MLEARRRLDGAAIQAALSTGGAVALLRENPLSPIRCRDRWYAVLDGTPDQLWRPVDDERGAQLDLMAARLTLAARPGGWSP